MIAARKESNLARRFMCVSAALLPIRSQAGVSHRGLFRPESLRAPELQKKEQGTMRLQKLLRAGLRELCSTQVAVNRALRSMTQFRLAFPPTAKTRCAT